MGTHLIPRSNVKGQDRVFIFFSFQGLAGTLIGAAIGYPFFLISNLLTHELFLSLFLLVAFAFAGFIVGQGKVPDNNGNPLFKKLGGLYVRDVILMYFRFKHKKAKYELQISEDDVFEEHEETKLEKILLNKQENEKDVTA